MSIFTWWSQLTVEFFLYVFTLFIEYLWYEDFQTHNPNKAVTTGSSQENDGHQDRLYREFIFTFTYILDQQLIFVLCSFLQAPDCREKQLNVGQKTTLKRMVLETVTEDS